MGRSIEQDRTLIRCRDCRHGERHNHLQGANKVWCGLFHRWKEPVGYCDEGKSKEEENKNVE